MNMPAYRKRVSQLSIDLSLHRCSAQCHAVWLYFAVGCVPRPWSVHPSASEAADYLGTWVFCQQNV